MSSLPLVRTIVLRSSNVLAFVVLALSAYTLSQVEEFYFTYSALGVATGVIHLASVTPMIILGLIRDGAFTSQLAVEVAWLSFLWIMWIATGGQAAAVLDASGIVRCIGSFCAATQAIAAFGFIIWAMLFGYVITLVCFAVRASQAGQNFWLTDVKHVRWVQGTANFDKPNLMAPHPTGTYPPNGHPGNMTSPVSPMPQYNNTGGHPGQFSSPVTPQPQQQYYPQQGGTYQV